MSAPEESTPQPQQPFVVQESPPQVPATAHEQGPAAHYGQPAQYAQQPYGQAAQYAQQSYGQPAQYAQQPYGQPAQYAQQPYGQPQVQQGFVQAAYVGSYGYTPSPPRGLSISSMVIGLVSLFFGFTFVLPIVGFVLGILGARKEPAGRAMAITGIVLNGLFLFAWVAIVLLWVFIIGGFFVGVGGAASTGISA